MMANISQFIPRQSIDIPGRLSIFKLEDDVKQLISPFPRIYWLKSPFQQYSLQASYNARLNLSHFYLAQIS